MARSWAAPTRSPAPEPCSTREAPGTPHRRPGYTAASSPLAAGPPPPHASPPCSSPESHPPSAQHLSPHPSELEIHVANSSTLRDLRIFRLEDTNVELLKGQVRGCKVL